MGYADEGFGSLCQVFTVKVYYAVFSSDVVYVGTGRNHTPAPCLRKGTILLCPFLVAADMAMMGLPPSEKTGAAHKVHLTTYAGYIPGTNAVCADLTGEVDLDGGVDGYYFLFLRMLAVSLT